MGKVAHKIKIKIAGRGRRGQVSLTPRGQNSGWRKKERADNLKVAPTKDQANDETR